MFKVIENFVPKIYQDQLEEELSSVEFAWFYLPSTTIADEKTSFIDQNCVDTPQFVHPFCRNGQITSKFYNLVHPFLYFMAANDHEVLGFWRGKSNLTLPFTVPAGSHSNPHVDVDFGNPEASKHLSMLYYVNDSDGNTIFFEESPKEFNGTLTEKQSVTPKKGTAVIFDSTTIHAGQIPTNSKRRMVANSIFLTH